MPGGRICAPRYAPRPSSVNLSTKGGVHAQAVLCPGGRRPRRDSRRGADELAEQLAEIKKLKERQRFYAAEGRAATEALGAVITRGLAEARYIRSCAVLLYGPKSGRLAQFGIRIRRRPRRKAESAAAAEASPVGHGEVESAAARDAA